MGNYMLKEINIAILPVSINRDVSPAVRIDI